MIYEEHGVCYWKGKKGEGGGVGEKRGGRDEKEEKRGKEEREKNGWRRGGLGGEMRWEGEREGGETS